MLKFDNLSVTYRGARLPAVCDVSLTVPAGVSVALVGASGAGKSTLGMAALGLLPPTATVSGRVTVDGIDVLTTGEARRARIRGWRVAHMSQSPSAALNPARRAGDQIVEAVALNRGLGRTARRAFVEARLREVGLEAVYAEAWPHELSFGQLRRVALAMALATDPALLVADEPAASLDTIRRAEVIALLGRLRRQRALALLLITHDLAFAGALCDEVAVVCGGRVVDHGPFPIEPRHPYTAALLAVRSSGHLSQKFSV